MANVGRISGPLLKSNLLRNGVDLAFETDLLYLDVSNSYIGVKNASPGYELDVTGTVNATTLRAGSLVIDDLLLDGSTLSTTLGSLNLQPNTPADFINLNGNVEVTGDLHATGSITADGDLTLGNADTDTVTFAADIGSDFTPDIDVTYNLGSANKRWHSLYVGGSSIYLGSLVLTDNNGTLQVSGPSGGRTNLEVNNLDAFSINTDSIEINDNYITTTDSNADLELRASGVGNVLLTSPVQTESTITANADVTINANLEVTGDFTLGGNITLGNADTDTITISADFESDLLPNEPNKFNIGNSSKQWLTIYANNGNFDQLNVEDIQINGNVISTTNSNANLELQTSGTGTIVASNTRITDVANPAQDQDAATKIYVDNATGSIAGDNLTIGTPTDGSYTDGAVQILDIATTVSDAVDGLNEALNNVRNNTFVRTVTFNGSPLAGGAGIEVTLSISFDGNPDRYEIDWGDGTIDDTTDTTPSHVYANNVGSPFTVTVRAYNSNGSGTGSEASFLREDYVIVYTADPVVDFVAYDALTGGNVVTFWDDGDTVYFENTTTNCTGNTAQWTWSWNDGSPDDVITNSDAGGADGARIAHTFTAQTETDVSRTVTLTLDTHNTADPTVIPTNDLDTFNIFDDHTPDVGLSTNTGINEEATSGLPVIFTNNTENTVGSFATFGIQYLYTFGDGATETVNAGSNADGDIGSTITHTYTLTPIEQANGTPRDYTGNLQVISNHSASPFASTNFTVHVEPDVRANISGTAITVSDKSGDNIYDIYDGTDYNGVNRALVRVTNTSQNADDYVYDWGDSSSNDTVTEDGSSAGSIGATLDHDYSGESIGNHTLTFTANGAPDITAQTDNETITFQLNSVPSAPAGLSTKSITLSTSAVGTSPRLASGFTDNSSSTPLSSGADLTTSTARRLTSGTVTTSSVNDVYDGLAGTLTASINGAGDGNKAFSTTTGETGTFTSLVVSQQVDVRDVNSSYPRHFYQVFDANISKSVAALSTGVSDFRLEHSTTGNTNYVAILKDDMTATPTFGVVGTLSEGTGGTKRYISGIPYYNTGSPTLTLSGATINNLVGQAYTNQSNIVEIDSNTNVEGTSSNAFDAQDYTYANIDGASTMLSSGIPIANTGTSSAYAIGDLTIPITSSSVRTVDTAHIRARNVNGISGYSNITGNIQVHTAAQSGISEIAIAISDSLGNGTYTDDGIRSSAFLAGTTDTPSYNGATNFYTTSVYSEANDPGVSGTQEATIRLGVLKHDTTDYSTGYLPVGPDRSTDTGTQYFTFAFRRQVVANFEINLDSDTGIAGLWIAAPGTAIDNTSGLNGWLDAGIQYAGSGIPGSNTGAGGNGADGCASLGADIIPSSTALNSSYTLTLGSENMSNATGNVVLVRIALTLGQSVNSVSIS